MIDEQLSFDLQVRTALGREDFFVSPANAAAVAMIDGWRDWPQRKAVLTGPRGAGKTHLAHVWAKGAGAQVVAAADLDSADIHSLAAGPVALEDAQYLRDKPAAQEAAFHLHNLLKDAGHSLLVTADAPPIRWGLDLPDLLSRLQAAQTFAIDPPDDALLAAVLYKLFADRQLAPAPDVVPFLVRRMTRSFDAAQRLVDGIDRAALAQQKPITRSFTREVMDKSGLLPD